MRFHLIDRIDHVEAHRTVSARKLTSHCEDYWRDDGRGPEMPSCLIFEALCQAGTWLVMTSTGLARRAALLSVDTLVLAGAVHPGDVLVLEGTVQSWSEETAVLSGRATVDDRLVLQADSIMCLLMPADDLEERSAIVRMHQQLLRAEPGSAA